MDEGEIVETGSPDQFFNDPKTERCKNFSSKFFATEHL